MTTTVDDPYFPASPSRLHRIDLRAIGATALVVIASLAVLLPLLPGADVAWTGFPWRASTTALFIGGAVLAVVAIGAVLICATRRSER